MKMNYWWFVIAYGAFYFFVPHSLHVSTGLGFGLEHSAHQLIGLGLIILGLIMGDKYG